MGRTSGNIVAVTLVAIGAATGCTTLLGDFQSGAGDSGVDGGMDVTTTDAVVADGHGGDTATDSPAACIPGGACSTPCATGVNVCTDGGLVCNPTTNTPDGTHCGTGSTGVCAAGQCTCPTGQALCGSTCTATASDGANCGFCGHACGAGSTCTTEFCTPVTVCSGASDGPIWPLGTTAIMLSFNQLLSCDLTMTGASATSFYRDPLNGLSFTSLSGTSTIAYFTEHNVTFGSNGLLSTDGTAANTNSVTAYPSSFASSLVTTTTDSVTGNVFIALTDQVSLEVNEGDAGYSPITCVQGIGNLTSVAAAGGKLFVADGTANNVVVATISSTSDCSATTVTASGLAAPTALTTDGTTVAFADNTGIYACSASLGCIPQSHPTALVTGQGAITQIAIDKATPPNLYWIGATGLATCSSSPSICNDKPHVLIPNATDATALFVDSMYVYYLEGEILYKVAE